MMEEATLDEGLADVEVEEQERKKTVVTATKTKDVEKSLKERAGGTDDAEVVEKAKPGEIVKEKATVIKEKTAVAAKIAAKTTKEGYHTASQGVDTFMNSMIDKNALVTKHWKLRASADKPTFFLSVRHYSLTKLYVLSVSGLLVMVNGKVVYRYVEPIGEKHDVPFKLSGHSGRLSLEVTPETKDKKNKKYTYTLFYGLDKTRRHDYLTDTAVNDDVEDLSEAGVLSVLRGDQMSIDGTPVQMYDVAVKTATQDKLVPKRFKDFDTLHRAVRSAFLDAGEEFIEELPKLPGKTFMKKSGDEFIEKRRGELETYIVELLKVDKMSFNPDVRGFFGLLGPIPSEDGSEPEPETAAAAEDDGI